MSSHKATEACECWTVECSDQPDASTPESTVPESGEERQPHKHKVNVVQALQQKNPINCHKGSSIL